MQSIMRADATGAVHANVDNHNPAATACGIVGGAWVSTDEVVSCQTCIRIMAAQVSKGIPHYRELLQLALDAMFFTPEIKPIELIGDSYNSLEIRWIKEKINELIATVNALVKEHTKGERT